MFSYFFKSQKLNQEGSKAFAVLDGARHEENKKNITKLPGKLLFKAFSHQAHRKLRKRKALQFIQTEQPSSKPISIFAIGNRLTAFADNQHVFTYKQFMALLKLISKKKTVSPLYEIRLGQGLTDRQIKAISSRIKRKKIEHLFSNFAYFSEIERAKNHWTHKRKTKNTMISTPEQCDHNVFKSYLMLNENCAEMSDHLTGQHIQGMVLTEAARQMINAVSEKYLIAGGLKHKGFVLHNLSSTFFQYVFPVEVAFHLTVTQMRKGLNGNFKAKVEVHVFQENEHKMSIDFDFSVMDKNTLLNIESQMAKDLMKQALRHVALPKNTLSVA